MLFAAFKLRWGGLIHEYFWNQRFIGSIWCINLRGTHTKTNGEELNLSKKFVTAAPVVPTVEVVAPALKPQLLSNAPLLKLSVEKKLLLLLKLLKVKWLSTCYLSPLKNRPLFLLAILLRKVKTLLIVGCNEGDENEVPAPKDELLLLWNAW